jgi:hypothetical protein
VNGFLGKGVANGHGDTEMTPGGRDGADTVQSLRDELAKTKQDNETLTMKYSNLVAKLTTMRNTVESKLKADAVGISLCLYFSRLIEFVSRRSLIGENSSCSSLVHRTRISSPPWRR